MDLAKESLLPILFAYLGDTESIKAEDLKKYVTVELKTQRWISTSKADGELVTVLEEAIILTKLCSELTDLELQAYSYIGESNYIFQSMKTYGICTVNSDLLKLYG